MIRFFTPLLIIGLALVSFFYFTTPILDTINDFKAERLKLSVALDNATKLKDKQKELLDIGNVIDPIDIANLKQLLPNNIDNVRLIIDINNIAQKRGLIVRNPSIISDASTNQSQSEVAVRNLTPDKSSVVISFSVSASYDILKMFLGDLDRSLRIVDIDSVAFSSNDKNLYDYKIS